MFTFTNENKIELVDIACGEKHECVHSIWRLRSGGNGLAPANLEDVGSDAGQEEPEVVGSDTELTTYLPPSHSAPITHHHGTQTNIPQSHSAHPQQTTQSTAHSAPPHTLSSSHHTTSAIATSSTKFRHLKQRPRAWLL